MSRIGRKIITLPQGVKVNVEDLTVNVSGPKGQLSQIIDKQIVVKQDNDTIVLERLNETNDARAKHGLYRTLINNMIIGVNEGFSKKLEVKGVGYRVSKQGNKLVMALGLSHTVEVEEIDGITITTPTQSEIVVSGIDKQLVGQVAAKIKGFRPVEPYHGYGIRYSDEIVIRKVGKTAGKK